MAGGIRFFDVAKLLDKLEPLKANGVERTDLLRGWIRSRSCEFERETQHFFRLLLPSEAGRTFFLGEERLAKLVADALGIACDSADAGRLRAWLDATRTLPRSSGGDPASSAGGAASASLGNLSLVVRDIFTSRVQDLAGGVSGQPITLIELDKALDALAAVGPEAHAAMSASSAKPKYGHGWRGGGGGGGGMGDGGGSWRGPGRGVCRGAARGQRGRPGGPSPAAAAAPLAILSKLYFRCSPCEAKWLVRIILRDMQMLSR